MLFRDKLESLLIALTDHGICFHEPGFIPAASLSGLELPYYPAESHSGHIEMIHLCAGQAAMQINGTWLPLTGAQPQVFLMNTRHSEHFLQAEEGYELLWLSLNPFMINLHTTSYTPGRGYGQSSLRQSLHPPRMEVLWRSLRKLPEERPRFMALLLDSLQHCLKNPEENSANYHATAIELVRRYLEDYYYREIRLSDLAEMSHYSSGHLSAIFRQAVKMPIYKYLSEIRLREAAKLLRGGKRRVKDVAAASGFRDQLYFCRQFRKKFGQSPSEYAAGGR